MNRMALGLAVSLLTLTGLAGCGEDAEQAANDAKADASVGAEPSAGESGAPEGGASIDPNAPGATSEYCKLLGADFASMFGGIRGPEDVDKAIGMVEDVADAAPQEIRKDWATMNTALGSMRTALKEAAVLQQKAEAGEVSKKRLQRESERLMKSMESLNTPENNKAGDAVAEHATDYCGINLG